MRHSAFGSLALALLAALPVAGCREASAPAAPEPVYPPGARYAGPKGAYLFVRPPKWTRVVNPALARPDSGAASTLEWRTTQKGGARLVMLTLRSYAPAEWERLSAEGAAPKGEVVAAYDSVVVVATTPANPYPDGDPGQAWFDNLVLPVDTVRARISRR